MNFCELETHCFDDVVVVVLGVHGIVVVVEDPFEAAADGACVDGQPEWLRHTVEACQVGLGLQHY